MVALLSGRVSFVSGGDDEKDATALLRRVYLLKDPTWLRSESEVGDLLPAFGWRLRLCLAVRGVR